MLVNSKEMLLDANSRDYAIPSPDFINLNMVRSYIEVAEKLDRPSIIAFSEGMQNFLSL